MGMKRALVTAIAGLLLAQAAPALAFRSTLIAGDARQKGSTVYWTNVSPGGKGMCSIAHADGLGEYPDAASVRPGPQEMKVRLHRPVKPSRLRVMASPLLDPSLSDLLQERAETRLRPVKRDGRVIAWDIVFDEAVLGDLYLDVSVEWTEKGRCAGGDEAVWTFHVRAP